MCLLARTRAGTQASKNAFRHILTPGFCGYTLVSSMYTYASSLLSCFELLLDLFDRRRLLRRVGAARGRHDDRVGQNHLVSEATFRHLLAPDLSGCGQKALMRTDIKKVLLMITFSRS